MRDEADREAEVAVELAHPLAVAAREVVVDRNHVDTLSCERIEVDRRRRDERLALARTHLSDAALVEADAADQLHVEMAHAENTPRALAHDRERLGQDLLHRHALCKLLAKFPCIARQLVVREIHHRGLKRVDLLHNRRIARDLFVIIVAEESF